MIKNRLLVYFSSMEKPAYRPGTVLALADHRGSKIIVVWISSSNTPTVVPFDHWRPNLKKEESLYHKVMHWAPKQREERPEFAWKDSTGMEHTLQSTGWSVYGTETAVCPDQTLPLVDSISPKQRPEYKVGDILHILKNNAGWESIENWKVIGHTIKGAPRVTKVSNSVTSPLKTLRWTKNGWKLGKYWVQ